MKLFWRKRPAPDPAPIVDVRAEFADELRLFTELFGVERGVQLVADGVPLVGALLDEVRRLRGVIVFRDSQIDDMNERLWALYSHE